MLSHTRIYEFVACVNATTNTDSGNLYNVYNKKGDTHVRICVILLDQHVFTTAKHSHHMFEWEGGGAAYVYFI